MLRAYGLLPVDGAKASDYDDDRLWFNNVADERLFGSVATVATARARVSVTVTAGRPVAA